MNTHELTKPIRNVKVSGISFQPHVWERLEVEAGRMDRPNRSLVVERALLQYFAIQDQLKSRGGSETVVIVKEGAA